MQTISPIQVSSSLAGTFTAPGLVTIQSSPARHGTMIAPDLLVVASHYIPPIGVAVYALSSAGESTSVIGHVTFRQADITIMRLKYALDKASIAPIATEAEIRKVKAPFVGLGWTNIDTAVQETTAANVALVLIQTDSADAARKARIALFKAGPGQPIIHAGDSGSPVYVQTAQGYKLAGVWNGNNASFQPASLLFPFKSQIDSLSL